MAATAYESPKKDKVKRRKLNPEEMRIKELQIAADQATDTPQAVAARQARVKEAYGTANPTQSDILKRSYALEKGGEGPQAPAPRALTPKEVKKIQQVQEQLKTPELTKQEQTQINQDLALKETPEAAKAGAPGAAITSTEGTFSERMNRLKQFGQVVSNPQQAAQNFIENPAIQTTISNAAEIFDSVTSAFTNRKGVKQQAAETALSDAMTALKGDLERAKTGEISPSEARRNFFYANAALTRLESSQKGWGKTKIRYWLDDGGKEVETSIIFTRDEIARMERELEVLDQVVLQQALSSQMGQGIY